MRGGQKAPRSIDEYIATFPDDVQVLLTRIRKTVRKAAPHAEETISYKMPTFSLEGFLVSFAAYRKPYRALSCAIRKREVQQRAVCL